MHKPRHGAIPQATQQHLRADPDDNLYVRRGYGQGGLVFGGGGQGGLAQAGTCADLAFAQLPSCGPNAHIGLYGNGIGYGFGSAGLR